MPLKPGRSKAVREQNFHELRHGPTFARTQRNEGTAAAEKQMVAIELSNERRHPTHPRDHRRGHH